jgi:hypothetical protein
METEGLLQCAQEPVTPNIVVEFSTLLLRIREVPSSNLGLNTGYPNKNCSLLSCPFRQMTRCLKLGHDRFLLHPFQFIIHLLHFHSTLFA